MPSYAYFQKQFMPLSEAKIGVMTHALHYGTAIFEGIRGNWNAGQQQMFIFRLREHFERMVKGCRLMKMDLDISVDQMCDITIELARKCDFKEDIYIRPLVYKSSEALGVRLHNLDCDFLVFAFPWGPYLDKDKISCAVSSWHRPDDNVMPPQVKLTGIYINNALAKTEAISNGYDEAIMLSSDGFVSEGSGENLFILTDGKLVTPATYNSILRGITRNTVIEMAQKELGLEVVERSISRAELYTADECFLTGTAAHLTPVAEIDRRPIADGNIGKITAQLQELYTAAIRGDNSKYSGWCTPVFQK